MLYVGGPTGRKRPDRRDGCPNLRPRRRTKSVGQETPRETDKVEGASTGELEDTSSTPTLEPPDPDGTNNDGGRAGGTASPVSRQERGYPAKKERLEATATGSW